MWVPLDLLKWQSIQVLKHWSFSSNSYLSILTSFSWTSRQHCHSSSRLLSRKYFWGKKPSQDFAESKPATDFKKTKIKQERWNKIASECYIIKHEIWVRDWSRASTHLKLWGVLVFKLLKNDKIAKTRRSCRVCKIPMQLELFKEVCKKTVKTSDLRNTTNSTRPGAAQPFILRLVETTKVKKCARSKSHINKRLWLLLFLIGDGLWLSRLNWLIYCFKYKYFLLMYVICLSLKSSKAKLL